MGVVLDLGAYHGQYSPSMAQNFAHYMLWIRVLAEGLRLGSRCLGGGLT